MNLKTLREQLKAFISQLHQKLDSRKQTNEQLRKEKVSFELYSTLNVYMDIFSKNLLFFRSKN